MDRVTVWDDRLSAGERATLRPGTPGRPDRSPDVLVVGGGVIGLSVAVACRRAGLGSVVVLERAQRLASAASGGNGGAIAPDMHVLTDGPGFVAFGRASRDLYEQWDAEWDGAIGLWPTRWLAAGLATVLPGAAGATVSHRWCCFRPYIEGRQPVIDRLPGVANGWFAGGHFTTGVMMAAATGAAIAGWIGGGEAPESIRNFTMPAVP